MYHENINVLEYASMSMNIKKSSAEAHMSIARSLRKPKTVKSKSPHMTKDVTSLNVKILLLRIVAAILQLVVKRKKTL